MAAAGAVAVVILALAALIWMVTIHMVQEQQADMRDRAEHALLAQAGMMAEAVAHELLLIDQCLAIIQAAWQQTCGSPVIQTAAHHPGIRQKPSWKWGHNA